MHLDIPELRGDNYKIWKEMILLHLGYMDIDYAIRKSEPPEVTEKITPVEVALFKRWERSNRLSVMFIKTKITTSIRGSVEKYDKLQDDKIHWRTIRHFRQSFGKYPNNEVLFYSYHKR